MDITSLSQNDQCGDHKYDKVEGNSDIDRDIGDDDERGDSTDNDDEGIVNPLG